jgi:hypothetical protein
MSSSLDLCREVIGAKLELINHRKYTCHLTTKSIYYLTINLLLSQFSSSISHTLVNTGLALGYAGI